MNKALLDTIVTHYAKGGDKPKFALGVGGRANIIGEHTDYNDGFVLPFAIDKRIYFVVGQTAKPNNELYSLDFMDYYHVGEAYPVGTWQHFVDKILHYFEKQGVKIQGLKVHFGADLPIGGGMSSSSALCCGLIAIINQCYDLKLTKAEMVDIASSIERSSGVRGGKMDQFAIFNGEEQDALLLDCATMQANILAIPKHWKFMLINSGVKHNLALTAYNDRRQDCEDAVHYFNTKGWEGDALRSFSASQIGPDMPEPCQTRARFVFAESDRVKAFEQAAIQGDIHQAAQLLLASHQGLDTQYDVSCPELNYLVDLAKNSGFIVGARMMGGGFGGCTINLYEHFDEAAFELLKHQYAERYGITPAHYDITPAQGMIQIDLS